ncbi:uncharacterized protein LOC109598694 isoform X2 [Aethina tumida]|uniref:uncharacterized protein LOC109598694 isoform X2 n=1 Tax=Aethina tumida TaxID=116153 RepID=UPI002149455E|nr:uncharacterized protein LOC109598694 isoform X2 [Aethina tumida]
MDVRYILRPILFSKTMNDCTKDISWDTGIIIKQEPILENGMLPTASVPIPSRKDGADYRTDFTLDLDNADSPLYNHMGLLDQFQPSNSYGDSPLWNDKLNSDALKTEALIHMDEDDIFQVDKADLIQGPTLAELNANDETLLGDLNFDDLLLPDGTTYITMGSIGKSITPGVTTHNNNNNNDTFYLPGPKTGIGFYKDIDLASSAPAGMFDSYVKNAVNSFSSASLTSSNSSLVQSSSPQNVKTNSQKTYTLNELLKQETTESNNVLVPTQGTPLTAANVQAYKSGAPRLSSSAPTHLGLEQIWARREPRKHLLSTSSLAEAGSTSSISTSGILSPDPQDLSHDELESDDESDIQYEDFSSENGDSDDDEETKQQKRDRYFWQYNVQAKGPKGQRLVMKAKLEDPHVLGEVQDPVFSPDCSLRGIKHSGKARKGDGNDLTPNPRKLFNIGKELDNLAKIINDMTPVNELPFNVRPTSRKEKNKLASRACRLKKKAQHEANKIKLNGLESEHRLLINGIEQVKQILLSKYKDKAKEKKEEHSKNLEKIAKNCQKVKIAGFTTDYVNKVLEKYKPANTLPDDL